MNSTEKGNWKNLHGTKKVQYIWDYYKLPIFLCLLFLYLVGYFSYRYFTREEVVLYTGLVNVSASEQLTDDLENGFLTHIGAASEKKTVESYTGLYLTDDTSDLNYQYAYASRIKIMASINNQNLDVVFMSKEAFDTFSQSGYLCNLEELLADLDAETMAAIQPYLTSNTVILEDNFEDMLSDESASYQTVTEEYIMGLNVSQQGLFKQAGFTDDVYLGVIGNSPRTDMAIEYIKYLLCSF